MATEKEYDEIIAPMLVEVARKADELGMSLVARVEWENERAGVTYVGDLNTYGQTLAYYAAHSHGNLDRVIFNMREQGIDLSRSIYLNELGKVLETPKVA